MDINQFYDIIKFIANKYSTGYIGPADFDTLCNISQDQVFNNYLDGVKGWASVGRDGKTFPGDTQPNTDSIAAMKMGPITAVVPGTGLLPKPNDLVYLDAIYKTNIADSSVSPVRRVEEDRLWSTISSVIDPIVSNPIYTEYDNSYLFHPAVIASVTYAYYRMPVRVHWGFTIVSGRPVYDAGSSIQFEWSDSDIMKILMRATFNLGIRIKDNELLGYSRVINNQNAE